MMKDEMNGKFKVFNSFDPYCLYKTLEICVLYKGMGYSTLYQQGNRFYE